MTKQYGILIWEHGRHCDEFEPQTVTGPYNANDAWAIECAYDGKGTAVMVEWIDRNKGGDDDKD